jgi:hypothetical protein
MGNAKQYVARAMILVMLSLLGPAPLTKAESRQVEFRFGLSNDPGSEFSAKSKVFSPGELMIEARWQRAGASGTAETGSTALDLVLLRPDGTIAKRETGESGLRLVYRVTEDEADRAMMTGRAEWTAKLINSASDHRAEVRGTLRMIVPVVQRTLADVQFTLLGLRNAQEMPFSVGATGRLVIEAKWETDPIDGKPGEVLPLMLSLTHVGQAKIYARRQGRSPLRIEHQITELDIDKGKNWITRIENGGLVKVKGILKITFTPSI